MMVMMSPIAAQTPHRTPQYLHPACAAINWAHKTDGQKGTMVNTKMATYFPRFLVGASSEVTARAVSSLIPAPAPATAMPATTVSELSRMHGLSVDYLPMKMFMLCAVDAIVTPTMIKIAPIIATYRRPIRSEREPTKGQTAASARRLARTNQVHLSVPPISP